MPRPSRFLSPERRSRVSATRHEPQVPVLVPSVSHTRTKTVAAPSKCRSPNNPPILWITPESVGKALHEDYDFTSSGEG